MIEVLPSQKLKTNDDIWIVRNCKTKYVIRKSNVRQNSYHVMKKRSNIIMRDQENRIPYCKEISEVIFPLLLVCLLLVKVKVTNKKRKILWGFVYINVSVDYKITS